MTTWLTPIESKIYSPECRPSTLPFGVNIAESCSFRSQDVCKVRCTHNGIKKWEAQARCLGHGKWSPLPMCRNMLRARSLETVDCKKLPVNIQGKAFCVKIKLPKHGPSKCPELLHIRMNLKNCSRESNSYCIITCGESFTNATCLPNGQWSHVPTCKSSRQNACPEIEVGTLINCSRREGEKCEILCPGGNIMSEKVVCLSSGIWTLAVSNRKVKEPKSKWEIISKCTCPPPNLTKEFEEVKDCKTKKIGQKCQLECKPRYSMIGKKSITCEKSASWSDFPICSNKTCPIPELSDSLLFKEDCLSKESGETCKLDCKSNLRLLDKKPLTCVNGTHWTKLPACTCFPPVLPDNVIAKGSCKGKEIGSACELKCKENYSITGLNFITCEDDGKWTKPPKCHSNFCRKPVLPKTLIFSEDCQSKRVGDTCQLECLNTEEKLELTCLNNTQWSFSPQCSCPKPSLSQNIELKENCLTKRPGEKCKISCKNLTNLKKHLYLTCQNNSQWSNEPPCIKVTCLSPVLPNYLLFDEDCTNKAIRQLCKLICKMGGTPTENEGTIKCLKGRHWSRFPNCTCPIPIIRDDLEASDSCSSKKPGEKCFLRCKQESSISNSFYILCKNDTTWTSQPLCAKQFCSAPKLPSNLLTEGNCSQKSVGDICEVYCAKSGSSSKKNNIYCLKNLTWSSFPSCTCPEPNLTKDLSLKRSCREKRPGDKCEVSCRSNTKLISGKEYITCENDIQWSPLPLCKEGICPTPTISPIFKFKNNCSSVSIGGICELDCSEEGNIIGNKSITCLNNLTWSLHPTCTCPEPNLREDLRSENCTFKIPGEKCNVYCINKFSQAEKRFILCNDKTQWSSQPICKKAKCRNITFRPSSMYLGKCSNKSAGDVCYLNCKNGGNFADGKNHITCKKNGAWTRPRQCLCPVPPQEYELKEDCSGKLPGETCHITCKNGAELKNRNYIKCDNSTRWVNLPPCEFNFCSPILLSNKLKMSENCTQKKSGETCKLSCENKGLLNGTKNVYCDEKGSWSPLPKCICPQPILPPVLELEDGCKGKTIGEQCYVACKSAVPRNIIKKAITCIMESSRMWSDFPNCTCSYPTQLHTYITLQDDCKNLKYFTIGKTCNVYCKNRGTVLNGKDITCLTESQWSSSPVCACAPPPLTNNSFLDLKNCSSTHPGTRCQIFCTQGKTEKTELFCDNLYRWEALPVCKMIPCQGPTFKGGLTGDNCTNLETGNVCKIKCINGARIMGSSTVMCIEHSRFTFMGEEPRCVCTPPILTNKHILKENCSLKRPGEHCSISCKDNLTLYVNATCLMRENQMWSPLPNCAKMCSDPRPFLSSRMVGVMQECMQNSFQEGDVCRLKCLNLGLYITENEISCLSNGSWSGIPSCSCPPLDSTEDVEFPDDCKQKFDEEECIPSCKKTRQTAKPIRCIGGKWERIVDDCNIETTVSCPDPRPALLQLGMGVEGECVNKQTYLFTDSCNVECKNGGHYITTRTIMCLEKGDWSAFPQCTCIPLPAKLDENLKLAQNCSMVFPNENCNLTCIKAGSKFKDDRNFIQCNTKSQWGPPPICEPRFMVSCPDPRPALLQVGIGVQGECVHKQTYLFTDSCNVECKNGGHYITTRTIMCLEKGDWSVFPQCTCIPLPETLNENLKLAQNCSMVFPNENCNLTCIKAGSKFKDDRNFIQCNTKSQWGPPPICEPKLLCVFPTINYDSRIEFSENCQLKNEHETCGVYCRDNALFLNSRSATSTITCMPGGIWSTFPTCACRNVTNFENWIVKEKCDLKKPGDYCSIWCNAERKYTRISCKGDGNWTPPVC